MLVNQQLVKLRQVFQARWHSRYRRRRSHILDRCRLTWQRLP